MPPTTVMSNYTYNSFNFRTNAKPIKPAVNPQDTEQYAKFRARVEGKDARRLFKETTKSWSELGYKVSDGVLTKEIYRALGLLDKFNTWQQIYSTPEERDETPFRDSLSEKELIKLSGFEAMVVTVSENRSIHPMQAVALLSEVATLM